MAVLTFEQVDYVKTIMQKKLKAVKTDSEKNLINTILKDLDRDPHTENVKEDITLNAENMGIELTDDQLDSLVPQVLNYDQSDYNAFINDLIDKEIPHDEEDVEEFEIEDDEEEDDEDNEN
jgi:hypothetical protein